MKLKKRTLEWLYRKQMRVEIQRMNETFASLRALREGN